MNKIFITTVLLGSVAAFSASAQNYNPYYQNNTSGNYYNYNYNHNNTNQTKMPQFKNYSIGFDYIMGTVGLAKQDFTIASPLPGGTPYEGSTDDFDDGADSLNINIGWRPFRYLGFEAFYQQSLSDEQVKSHESYSLDPRFSVVEYDMKYKAYGLDAIVYIPVFSRLDLLATVGVAKYDFSSEIAVVGKSFSSLNTIGENKLNFDEDKVAFRYGGGAQVWLSQRLAFRAMYRYTSIGGDAIDDISEISLGLRYNF